MEQGTEALASVVASPAGAALCSGSEFKVARLPPMGVVQQGWRLYRKRYREGTEGVPLRSGATAQGWRDWLGLPRRRGTPQPSPSAQSLSRSLRLPLNRLCPRAVLLDCSLHCAHCSFHNHSFDTV